MRKIQIKVSTPAYVMLSSDYSAQEPRLTAYISGDPSMIDAFQHDRDIYASIASKAFNVPYEKCLEFHPVTHEYQPDGKARRGEAKTVLLGVTYGRAIPSIAEQLYGKRDDMTEEQKLKAAQGVYDSVMKSYPKIEALMKSSQEFARVHGYTETILGRRRHHPNMQLQRFEFKAMKGYVNPDVDPLDPTTLDKVSDIPDRIVAELTEEFSKYKYFGQIARRTKELYDQGIKVINNSSKINDASRQVLNCVDEATEILTTSGWKSYKDIVVGEEILSFNVDSRRITKDKIEAIHIYDESPTEVICFKSPTFDAMSTPGHRWVCNESTSDKFRFITSEHIERNKWPDYPILRVWDNDIESTCDWSDDQLKLFGWMMTDGSFSSGWYGIELCQTVGNDKNRYVYQSMIETLDRLGYEYTDRCTDGYYHVIYLRKNDWLYDIFKSYQKSRQLTYQFISTLNQHQAEVLMWAMIEGDGTLGEDSTNITYTCSSKVKCDMFQYLVFVAGYASNYYETTPEEHNGHNSSNICYPSVSNKAPIQIHDSYFTVCVYRIRRAQIYPNHKSRTTVNMVWCVTTGNSTWVARRNGKVYVTGNSIIQGSAADETKLAMLMLEANEEWQKLGGRILVPVHDELICEVPMQHWKRGGEILSSMMCKAAEFLPFPSKCDVTTSLRWYGLEYPCPYIKPQSSDLDNLSEDDIKWYQYHLVEMEYLLPVFKDANGDKPKGDAAVGVNGIDSEEFRAAIASYIQLRQIDISQFRDFIEYEVLYGQRPKSL